MNLSKLNIELRPGEVLHIGDAQIELVHKSGQRARLEIRAPKETKITTPVKPLSAHECASSPEQGKEHSHGQYPV